MNTRIDTQEAHPANKGLLLLFWAYVLIPLAWGVTNTLTQAIKLFQ
ncbi:oxalate/formate antiporter [Caballeronia novacaledonica]|uniref:Oxalate/formate antiporter n=1 Tax=Caballeronia novacaledonica TaxID=1544861 RepID=A0A2U3I5V1_9BURK|nr:oxalate:formate antiporter [Caballeronia novacaledonica]SPB15513.1 oxalate/formate antiporter [Caballeronia novacaledonica]